MSTLLVSGEFVTYAGAIATFLFAMPISVKLVHIVRVQVRKILEAMEGEDDSDDDSEDDEEDTFARMVSLE